MKKLLSFVLVIAMSVTMLSVPTVNFAADSDGSATNYLSNGDFETDIWSGESGWSVSTSDWNGLTVDMATDVFKDGTQCTHYYSTSKTDVTYSQDVNLEAGTYKLTAYVMGENATPSISLDDVTESGELTGWNQWNPVTATITLDEAKTVSVKLKADIEATGWGYFDAVTLVADDGTGDIEVPTSSGKKVAIKAISGLSEDFMRGVDISSVISEEKSGVKFYNTEGEEEDIFKILSDAGVNYIRVRVWNDPKDANGNYYGGGNNDIDTAVEIAKRAQQYGMKLYVDFQYSDFWASPAYQALPKAWKGLTVKERAKKIKAYTTDSLNKIADTGVTIGMVSVGNETSGYFCGSKDWSEMCTMFNGGAAAIRAFDKNIKIIIHFAGSSMSKNVKFAGYLQKYKVDYDVIGLSWYAFYNHKSLATLKSTMNQIVSKYGKEIIIAENSYPVRFDDSDGSAETFGDDSYLAHKSTMTWNISPQGQAEQVRDVIAAVNSVNKGKGIGYFYWEPAWITVGDTTDLKGDAWQTQFDANYKLWQTYGSGWASSYAGAYRSSAKKYAGGSSWDNQAMFDTNGVAYDSINVFKYIYTGSEGSNDPVVTKYTEPEVTLSTDDALDEDAVWKEIWWNNVECTYSDGNTNWSPVKRWINSECTKVISAYKAGSGGDYTIHGILDDDEHTIVSMKVSIHVGKEYIKSVKLSKTSCTYNGKTQKPSVKVINKAGNTLVKNSDYKVTYSSGCKNIGTYNVTVKGIGHYSFSKTLTYQIVPKGTSISALSAYWKAFYVTYKKGSKISGYQVQYSTSKEFSDSKTKSKKYSAKSSTKHKITDLKRNTKYYVRVRTYQKVSSETYYSSWSKAKTVMIK